MTLPRNTPSYLIALAMLGLLMFVAWRVGIVVASGDARAERAEERNDQLVEILVEGRDEWGPALQNIEDMLTQLCEAEPGCTPP